MAVLFEKTKLLTDKQFHYCPGCNHGIIHRLVAEVIDEMNLNGKVIGVAPWAAPCLPMTTSTAICTRPPTAAHPLLPPVSSAPSARTLWYSPIRATATWRLSVPRRSFTPPTAARKITTIFVNNAIYGMTGGQMAPTTLIGQRQLPALLAAARSGVVCLSRCARCWPLFPVLTTLSAWRSTIPPTSPRPEGHCQGLPSADGG